MEKKGPPKKTGVSKLTGKIVRVRHATEADMAFIQDMMKKYHFDSDNLDYKDYVVATEDRSVIGFGSLKKSGGIYEVGCIAVLEGKRGRGVGQLIARHLADFATLDRVYLHKDLAGYFESLGFTEMKHRPKEYLDALDLVCSAGDKTKKVLLSREIKGK